MTEAGPSPTDALVCGSQIRAARALIGWTQRDLGDALDVDVRQVRFWERRVPSSNAKREKIAKAFSLRHVEFIGPQTPGVRVIGDASPPNSASG